MSTIDRPLSGDLLTFDLEAEVAHAEGKDIEGKEIEGKGALKRVSRTLAKQGPLRVTVVSLGGGEGTDEHSAPGPVTIHGLRGVMVVRVGDQDLELGPGRLVSLGPGVRHRVTSSEGGVFLLTVVHTD